jgi:hypothetical protein
MMAVGLLFLTVGSLSIRSEMIDDSYALVLLSLALLFGGSLNAIIRVRALKT